MMGSWSCSQFIMCSLCHCFFLTLFLCSSMRSHTRDTVFCWLLQCESFPVLPELLHHESIPWGWVLQEHIVPVWFPSQDNVLPSNLLQYGLLSTGCSSCQEPALVWMGPPTGCSLFQGISTRPHMKSSVGCRGIPAPPGTYMSCREMPYLTMVLTMGCRGIFAQSLEPLSFCTLVCAGMFFSHILTLPAAVVQQFSPLLNMASQRADLHTLTMIIEPNPRIPW